MPVLSPQQRTTLEKAVKEARKTSEIGAFNALQASAVNHAEPFAHMTPEQRTLRNALRSKARLLGDELEPNGIQQISNLAYELAYETWHKMLFATFLEANDLLMHHSGIAVTFADCEELAKEENYTDKWDAAAAYASKMLPAIFRIDDPLMQVKYATNDKIKLEVIIDGLEKDIFTADDALGWVYQFWQSEAKATINASGEKIDGAKLPAVTQLFTEPYMVHFLIDNTLGAWWVSRNPGVTPPIKFEYLRYCNTEHGEVPAAGNFEGWPNKTAQVTSLDPCMGSGHFVASLFPVFATLRMHEEGLSKEEVIDKVITENLHGLELDARCTQIAAFNLALTAWKFCGHYKELPEMNLACSGIAPKGNVEDWVKLVGKVARFEDKERMANGMRALYNHFQLAPELGSLLDPTTIRSDIHTASFEELQPNLEKALQNENDSEQLERGVIASGIAKAGELLSKKYTLIITNVPYLSAKKQGDIIKDFCLKNYPKSKGDLATVFFERMIKINDFGGTSCAVTPQNWLFLTTYKEIRKSLLEKCTWNIIAKLGVKGFQTAMWDFNVMLLAVSKIKSSDKHLFSGIDVSTYPSPNSKDDALKKDNLFLPLQRNQISNPDSRIVFENIDNNKLLKSTINDNSGCLTGDGLQFYRYIWEQKITNEWDYLQSTSSKTMNYSGMNQVIFWEEEKGKLYKLALSVKHLNHALQNYRRGNEFWGKKGIVVSSIGKLPSTIYTGTKFDQTVAVLVPHKSEDLIALWCYVQSSEYNKNVRQIDQKLNVTNATLTKVPFDLEHWQKVATEKYPNGLPKPYSDDPTQWIFHGHPLKAGNPLQVATARLLGYRWPAESDEDMELAEEAKKLIEEAKSFDSFTDDDGIFCIPSVNAEQAGADRLRAFLQAVFGADYNNKTINDLLEKEGAKASNLEDWFRNEFFIQHCKVFGNRPFIWHIWDGRKDGFSALVNYHKLDKENLSKLIYTYLGDWIRMCEAKRKAGDSGADGLWDAANKLQEKLILILNGEAPYDIFVRWKPLSEQPIGWEPDLNDGVRLNIRPFVEAGVLRSKFNIKWGIDRGKNPPNSHWGEIRDNDKHLSLEEKRVSRESNK